MVSKPTRGRKALILARRQSRILTFTLFLILIPTLVIVFSIIINHQNVQDFVRELNFISDTKSNEESNDTEQELPVRVDFQPVIDDWVKSTNGTKSVAVFDLDRNEEIGTYKPDDNYNTASLYKLFVVYEGYRRIQNGDWQGGDLAGSTGYTISKCLDLAIRESNSTCAETLWKKIGNQKLDSIIENDFEIKNSKISSLSSNTNDVAKMMRRYYFHPEISDTELIGQIKDSFLNQPVTSDDWRKGLPSGFKKANVYNKVGWAWGDKKWDYYHDAAIVEFPEQNRHFVVVVMTSNVSNTTIAKLGSAIEETFLVSTK